MQRILLIQDEELKPDDMPRRLMKRGFQVQFFSEVEPGLAWARAQPPDLILLDMDLTDMDGWKAARLFKGDPATEGVPIVAMANDAVEGAEDLAMDAGCALFMHLPVEMDIFMEKVKSLLEGSGAA